MGSYNLDDIRIDGHLTRLENFKLPPLGGEASHDNPAIQALVETKSHLVPTPDPDGCTACGTCIDQCPADALAMVDDLPEADMGRCVTCFCCQEICPEKAMHLQPIELK
ncbi:conserved hypothetical protein [Desulfosarcina cetonica]|nr:conserved hypothetical protein [Desulfosarcina cetonica]